MKKGASGVSGAGQGRGAGAGTGAGTGAGYSGTPLPKKLGLKEGQKLAFPGAPAEFYTRIGSLPAGSRVIRTGKGPVDLVIVFTDTRASLRTSFVAWERRLATAGSLWVAWPKKASGRKTDLDENQVRAIGLATGLVDNKVCAIDETWSGLRFVRRLKDR